MKRLNMKTFVAMAKTRTLTTDKKKTIQIKAERNLLGRLLMLSRKGKISLQKLFTYPLAPIPWSLATADGDLVKTDKSQLMHILEARVKESPAKPAVDCSTVIIDGNAMIQAMTSLPPTFEDLANSIFIRLPKAPAVHFVTDRYLPDSIKQLERNRRGIAPTSVVSGPKTKLPRDFKSFLLNGDNKRQLIQLLLREWQSEQYAPLLQGRKLYFVCEENCFCLQSADGLQVTSELVPELVSSQEEADTRIVLHCQFADCLAGRVTNLIVQSPDTDVFILLLYYSDKIKSNIYFETGTGNKRRVIDIKKVAGEVNSDVIKALPGFHAFTGCDCTSAFMRRGKRGPLKVLEPKPLQSSIHAEVFQRLGVESSCLSDTNHQSLEHFVCAMYGKPTYTDINQLRCDIFETRYEPKDEQQTLAIDNGIDLSLLPPCKSSLRMHALRANYQAYIWKNAHIASVTLPKSVGLAGCGWKVNETDSSLEIDWTFGDILPTELMDIIIEEGTATETTDGNIIYASDFEPVEEADQVDNEIDAAFDDEDED